MRILLLSWDARAADGGLSPQVAGLARELTARGDGVRIITRLPDGRTPPVVPGIETHAVLDPPPVLPPGIDQPLVAALSFASVATAVAVRRLEDQAVDVVLADGWQTGPVAANLQSSHDVEVVASLRAADLQPGGMDDGGDLVVDTARALARSATRVICPTQWEAALVGRLAGLPGEGIAVVPAGVDLPAREPGRPPAAGPLLLATAADQDHRSFARAVRAELATSRRITTSRARRPFAAAVLDPQDLDTALAAMAAGIPVLATAGPVGEVVAAAGAGTVIEPTPHAVARAVDDLQARPDIAEARGRAAFTNVSDANAWDAVAQLWRDVVFDALQRHPAPHVVAATASATA